MDPKRFSITNTTINIKKLQSEIFAYRQSLTMRNYQPYLFMNADTINELIKIVGYNSEGLMGAEENCLCGYFNGCKVFCNNLLGFGEIELR